VLKIPPWLAEPQTQLKMVILKDASKPNGDAIKNGALLSASELQAQGHFINSPSDIAPALADKTKDSRSDDESEDKEKDKSYQLPKCSNMLDNEAPESIYGSDGRRS